MSDLVQEAGLGLMKAADKFDPERCQVSTYAVWWIKASVQDYGEIGLWYVLDQQVAKIFIF